MVEPVSHSAGKKDGAAVTELLLKQSIQDDIPFKVMETPARSGAPM